MHHLVVMEKTSNKTQAGFTLIEILIALLLFSVGILATISMQISALQGNGIARNNTQAAAIAASIVEDLRSLPYAHDSLLDTMGACSGSPQGTDPNYTVCYSVQNNAIIANTKLIRVVVGWSDGATQRNLNLDYLIPDII